MSLEARIESLERKHKELHSRIEALEGERAPSKYIKPLKKEKLVIKDELQSLYTHGMTLPGNTIHDT